MGYKSVMWVLKRAIGDSVDSLVFRGSHRDGFVWRCESVRCGSMMGILKRTIGELHRCSGVLDGVSEIQLRRMAAGVW